MADRPPPLVRFAPPVAALLLFLFSLHRATGDDWFPDFFIYRAGADLGWQCQSPYDSAAIRARVATHFPDLAEAGFFLPPLAVILFGPFALLAWPAAKLAWAGVYGLAALGVAYLPRRFTAAPPPVSPLWAVAPFALLLNPVALGGVGVGQTTLVCVGCVAAGQWCFERKWWWLGCVLWAVPFVKPHLALPLLPLAWYLHGWKRAAGVAAVVGLLTLAGCQVAGGSPLFLRDYATYLADGHKGVAFNRAELNPQIASWNRLLFAAGGPLIELSALSTLGGYLVWGGLVLGRCAATGVKPSAAWAVGAAAAGAVLCAQVLVYELLALALLVPLVRELFAAGFRVVPVLILTLLAVQLVPQDAMEGFGFGCHRPLGVFLLAGVVLAAPAAGDRPLPSGEAESSGLPVGIGG